jgi:hypothetical protein
MRVLRSALKHGVAEVEIMSALQVPLRRVVLEPGKMLVIGADSAARLLEVVVADFDGHDPRVIHAMELRKKFHLYLE